MYNLEPILLENMILRIVNDSQTLNLYEKNFPNWMNSLFTAIKNKQFPFCKLNPDLYDLYKVFIINDLLKNNIQNVSFEFIKKTYFE